MPRVSASVLLVSTAMVSGLVRGSIPAFAETGAADKVLVEANTIKTATYSVETDGSCLKTIRFKDTELFSKMIRPTVQLGGKRHDLLQNAKSVNSKIQPNANGDQAVYTWQGNTAGDVPSELKVTATFTAKRIEYNLEIAVDKALGEGKLSCAFTPLLDAIRGNVCTIDGKKIALPAEVPLKKWVVYGQGKKMHFRTAAGDMGLEYSPVFALSSYSYRNAYAQKDEPYFTLGSGEPCIFDGQFRQTVRIVLTFEDTGALDSAPTAKEAEGSQEKKRAAASRKTRGASKETSTVTMGDYTATLKNGLVDEIRRGDVKLFGGMVRVNLNVGGKRHDLLATAETLESKTDKGAEKTVYTWKGRNTDAAQADLAVMVTFAPKSIEYMLVIQGTTDVGKATRVLVFSPHLDAIKGRMYSLDGNKANLPEDVPTTKFLTYGGSTAGTIHLRTTAGDIGLKLSPPFALQSYAYADRWAGKRVPYFLLSNSEEITFDSKYREEVRVVITLDDSGNLDEAPKPIAFETPAFPIETPHRIHVNAVAPNAADSNPGTAEQPLKSINQAAQLATPGTRIVIHPGVYRESIVVKNSGTAAKPILFEGTKKGEVIVSGSDVWNGWQPGTDKDVYVHPWTFRWGLVAYPPGWEGAVTLQDIVRRREMIFLNGKPLRQVLNLKNLEPESFFVSEEEKKVYLRLPAGASMDGASVEVATRSALATVSAKQYVGFRNLVFQHDNTPLQGSALRIQNSSNILVEDCAFLWNNWSGLGIAGSRDLILRRIDASDNGGAGILAFQVFRCLMEDAETSRNTWRGAAGGFTGWAVAGVKLLRIHNWMVRRHRAVGNHSGGFWLDCDNENLMIEDCYWADNESRGCFIELSQGPITIRNTVIANNGGPGLITSNCRKITLEGNTFYGNRSNAQIAPRGVKEFSELTNYRTQEQYKLRNEEWVLKNNTVVSTVLQTPPLKVSGPGLELFFKTLTASRNLYFCPDPNQAFEISDVRMSLAKWQEASGQDLDSLFGEPRFRDVTKGRFDPAPGSPLLTRDSWEIRKLVGGAKDIMAGLAEEMLHESKTNWETPYALAKGHPDSGWHVLDLAAAANRGVSAKGQFSWIGVMPLEHFEAGEKRIHGVPFRILDEDMNNGAAAIALRSAKLDKQRDGTPYPDMVEIGLRKKAKAIYVLHASAYADTHEKIGRYEFVYKDGTTAGVDVVPFGKASIHLDVNNTLARESNIQDWYPSNPQFENENAKKVIVLDPKNPLKHVRYLYTLQWVNPHPDKEIAVIRLMSEPDKHVMLLVLGVTAMM